MSVLAYCMSKKAVPFYPPQTSPGAWDALIIYLQPCWVFLPCPMGTRLLAVQNTSAEGCPFSTTVGIGWGAWQHVHAGCRPAVFTLETGNPSTVSMTRVLNFTIYFVLKTNLNIKLLPKLCGTSQSSVSILLFGSRYAEIYTILFKM